jgi:hypothetical protein
LAFNNPYSWKSYRVPEMINVDRSNGMARKNIDILLL